jgi:NADH:ubiquinone reductase (H+-translocating)
MSGLLDPKELARPAERLRPVATSHPRERHRVVVVGGGFAGLQAVRKLAQAPVDVTLIDRRNFHLFQPLAYQVATGALSPAEIASPLRGVLRHQTNARVLLAEVSGFDLKSRRVLTTDLASGEAEAVGYDTLIVAGGSEYSYFGHDEWEQLAPAPKGLEETLEIRRRLLSAFEAAETEHVAARRQRWLTFVVVGGGPTGVEMAGQIAEMARRTLRREFRRIDPREARILLIEASDRVLGTFPPRLSASAQRQLERLGVSVLVGRRVLEVDKASVTVEDPEGTLETIPACVIVWAAGVHASGLARLLADASDGRVDGAGRLEVEPDLTIPGHPEVFAIGDMITIRRPDAEPAPLPGVAPSAMQQGRYAGRVVRRRLQGRGSRPFHYFDKGNLATIGKAKAVADLHHGVELSGFIAWLTWLFVHLFYLIGVQNRLVVFTHWTASFLTNGRSDRIITTSTVGNPPARPRPRSARS